MFLKGARRYEAWSTGPNSIFGMERRSNDLLDLRKKTGDAFTYRWGDKGKVERGPASCGSSRAENETTGKRWIDKGPSAISTGGDKGM